MGGSEDADNQTPLLPTQFPESSLIRTGMSLFHTYIIFIFFSKLYFSLSDINECDYVYIICILHIYQKLKKAELYMVLIYVI